MDERRRAKRIPVTLSLEINNLYKQDNVQVSNLNAPITVKDVSQTGIGFVSESILPLGYYFNANLTVNSEDTLRCVVKIIRNQPSDDGQTIYGCEFIGMADVLSYVFEELDGKSE